jgi:hypothetical protein
MIDSKTLSISAMVGAFCRWKTKAVGHFVSASDLVIKGYLTVL